MKRNSFSLLRAIFSQQWHIHQATGMALMPMAMKFMNGELTDDYEDVEKEGLSPEATRLLQQYQSLNGEAYISERDTWYYDNFPIKIGEILTIPIIGAITQEDYCGTAGTKTIKSWYEKAKNDPEIKAIIEIKNTPGGQVFGTRALADYKAEYPKQIVGLCEGMECSAGLYIGATDDYKFAVSPECIIGSCGVMTTFQNWSGWYEKQGIIIQDVYSKGSPLKNDSYRKAMKGDMKGYTDGILFELDKSFMSFMQTYRPNISTEALKGADYASQKALENGLINEIGSFDKAYEKALELSKTTKVPNQKNNIMTKVKMFVPSALVGGIKLLGGQEITDENENPGNQGEGDNKPDAANPIADPQASGTTGETPKTPEQKTPEVAAGKTAKEIELEAQIATLTKEKVDEKTARLAIENSFKALQTASASNNAGITRSVARQQGADMPPVTTDPEGIMEGEDEFKAHHRVK